MRTHARFIGSFVIAGLLSFTASSVQSAGAPAIRHLYVSVYGKNPHVLRYRLVHGKPEATPDWIYSSAWPVVIYYTLAVDSQGNLFAATGNVIDVFEPTSHRANRRILIPQVKKCDQGNGDYVDAIAVDRQGYLYATTDNFYSGAPPRHRRSPTPDRFAQGFCTGTLVYAPGAHGHAMPVQSFAVPPFALDGVSVDAAGNLFVSDYYTSQIFEYATALTNPTLVRTFRSSYVSYPEGLATDPAGDVYAMNYAPSTRQSFVDFYTPGDSGGGPPSRELIMLASYGTAAPSIALDGPYLYAEDSTGHLEVYDALANGKVAPLYSLPIKNGGGGAVAVGP